MKKLVPITVLLVVSATTVAGAQGPPDAPPPDPNAPGDPPVTGTLAPDEAAGQPPVQANPPVVQADPPIDPYAPQGPVVPPPPPDPPTPMIDMPELLAIPTAFLLPAAVIYTKLGVDTGGGVSWDSRIGLGDVAEFGLATTDTIRERLDSADHSSERIQPYWTASFRLGVAERRLFAEQPAVALGFRKSFEQEHDGYTSRVAELTLVASKHIGKRFAFHVGGSFWDASLAGDLDDDGVDGTREVTLHGIGNVKQQLRPFGGLEVRPLDRSLILVDLGWAPEFCLQCIQGTGESDPDGRKIRLRPVLSWGVRYEVATWMRFESGVRVPDIGDANLLNAQIFGQVSFTAWGLRRAIDRAK